MICAWAPRRVPVPRQTELAAAWITLWWPLGPGGGDPLAGQPGHRASSPCQHSGCSMAVRKGWSIPRGWPGRTRGLARHRPGPLTCPSVLGSQGRRGQSWVLAWLWHCPAWPELLQGSVCRVPGVTSAPAAPVCDTLQLCFSHAGLAARLFSSHSCSSFQCIKKASAPPLASSNTVLGRSAVAGVTGRAGVTTAPLCLQSLQSPSV